MAILSKPSTINPVIATAQEVVCDSSAMRKAFRRKTLTHLQLDNFRKMKLAGVGTRGIEEFLRSLGEALKGSEDLSEEEKRALLMLTLDIKSWIQKRT